MTFQQFIETFNGKYIDFDGAYGAQCMDLAHYYCVQVLGLTDPRILAAPSSRDVYLNFLTVTGHEYFDKIDNTPTGVPKEGDIVYWTNAPYGHVAVFVEGNSNSFRSFDQNFPTGSPCHIQNHTTYANVIGWLRCKQPPQVTTEDLIRCQKQLSEEIIKKNTTFNELVENRIELEAAQSEIQSYKDFQTSLAVTLKCHDQPTAILGQITKLISEEDQLRQVLAENQTLKSSEAVLMTEKSQEKTRADNCLIQNKTLVEANTVSQASIVELEGQLKATQQVYFPLFEIFGIIICKRK